MFYGLKVNVVKSKVFLASTTKRSKMDLIISITGLKPTLTVDEYLGFPMLHGHLERKDFEFLQEKISHKLASWQYKLLNKVSRLTLVRSVLNSIPNH